MSDTPRDSTRATQPPAVRQLISLGGGSARGSIDRGPERRVVLSGLVGSAAFLAAAAAARLTGFGGGTWMSLHLALAGGAGLAIATLLPHFTVSLAGARPASWRVRVTGLVLVASGAAVVTLAYPLGWQVAAVFGAGAYLAGLLVSAAVAFIPARAGLGRRFGVVEAAYGLALVNGAIAVSLAILRLSGVATVDGAWIEIKPAHAWLNLVGFLSLVVAATLIHLYPTVVGSRIRSRPALLGLLGGVGLGAPLTAVGYITGSAPVAQAGALSVAGGAVALLVVAAGAWSRRGRWTTDLAWHRLTIGHLSAAIAWFVIGTAVLALGVVRHGADPVGWSLAPAIGPIVIGWALQALVGAWSHLLPAVGPGDAGRHAAQRRTLGRWAAPRLVAWNAGTLMVVGGAWWPGWLDRAGLGLVGATLLVSLALLAWALVANDRRAAAGPLG